MAASGDIVVTLAANAAAFKKGIDEARSTLSALKSSANIVSTAIGGMFSVQAIKSTVGNFIGIISEGISRIDDLAAESDKLGVSTEFLSGLEHAAALSDTSVESLTAGLEMMNKTLGNAEQSGGAAAKSIEDLVGKSIKEVIDSGPEQAFLDIADAIAKIDNPLRRAAAAQDAFGKGGQNMVNLLSRGSSGIRALQDELRRSGGLISGDAAKGVGAADDAIKRMQASIGAIKNQLAIEFAPIVKDLADAFRTEFVPALRSIIPAIKEVAGWLKTLIDPWRALLASLRGFRQGGFAGALKAFDELDAKMKLEGFGPRVQVGGQGPGGGAGGPGVLGPDLLRGPTASALKASKNPALEFGGRDAWSAFVRAATKPAVNAPTKLEQLAQQQVNKLKDIDDKLKNQNKPAPGPAF